jgi:hypothetical protein
LTDLAIYDDTLKVGFGLWNYRGLEFGLETAIPAGGIFIYLKRNTFKSVARQIGVIIFGVVLILIQAGNTFVGRPLSSGHAVAVTALIFYTLFAGVAFLLKKVAKRSLTSQRRGEMRNSDCGLRKKCKCSLSPMRSTFSLVAVAFIAVHAGLPGAAAQSADKKLLHATLARDRNGEPTTTFRSDSAKIYTFWKGNTLKAGDKIRAVWIAEGIGYTALKDAKITEASATAYKPDDNGSFALARPKGGWPAGKYRLELYVGDRLAETLKFTIDSDVTVEVR